MKHLRTALLLLLVCLLMAALITGCSPKDQTGKTEPTGEVSDPTSGEELVPPTTIRLGGLRGPTTMGMVKMLKDSESGDTYNKIEFELAGSADELTTKLVTGELDMLAVPANLAAVLHNNTEGKVQLLAINTLGVIYIVENGEAVQSFEDLRGKTIYATGRGSTPEYALNYILKENGLDPETDLTIDWKSEPTEVVALMQQHPGSIAMLPQPYVTVAQNSMEGLRIAIDLTQAWEDLDNTSMLITGVLAVCKEFAEQYPAQIDLFLQEYKASTEYANSNPAETAALIEEYGIVNAAIAQKALPYCNITYLAGSEMKQAMQGYLQVLYDQNAKSVGGKLPGDDFYYGAQ